MDNCRKDLLNKVGRLIGYKQMLLFTFLLLYSCHYTYNATSCPFVISQKLCIVFTILVLIVVSSMFILAFILALGISLRQAECLRPWLLMTVVMLVLGVAFLSFSTDYRLTTLGALILALQIISWYPIYRLYHKYCSETGSESSSVEENNPLSVHSDGTTPYHGNISRASTEAYSDDPPSYDAVMGMESAGPPCFEDDSNCVWSNDFNSKARIL